MRDPLGSIKSWFVDFDPVRAKAEGRPTGLPPEIGDLFSDELVIQRLKFRGMEVTSFECAIEIESGRRPKGGIDKSLRRGIPSLGAETSLRQSLTLAKLNTLPPILRRR